MKDREQNGILMGELLGGIQAPSLKQTTPSQPEEAQVQTDSQTCNSPKNYGHGGASKIKSRYNTSLTVDKVKYDKIKHIALANGLNINEILDAAMELYINVYEENNGPITPRESRISAISLVCTRKSKSHEG